MRPGLLLLRLTDGPWSGPPATAGLEIPKEAPQGADRPGRPAPRLRGALLVDLVAAVPTPLSAAAPAVFTAAVQIQVRPVEEPCPAAVHGQDHRRHAGRTGRFLPGAGRLGAGGRRAGIALPRRRAFPLPGTRRRG
ncbi:hypothetical protein GCM10009605_12020 [Nocardiopsis composta]